MKKIILIALVAIFGSCNKSKDHAQIEANLKTTDSFYHADLICNALSQTYLQIAISHKNSGEYEEASMWLDSAKKYNALAVYFNRKADSVNKSSSAINDKMHVH